MNNIKKIVLAYSGGLDTSVILKWLKEKYQCPVVAFAADLGQGEELAEVGAKARATGADEVFIEDLKEEFVRDFVWPMFRANALYEGAYLLGTSIARPLIAKAQVEVALRVGADAVSHGATGKGNDQVRFELTYQALAPDLKIIAPLREWQFKTRDEEIEFARERGIPVPATKKSPYSLDENLWGVSIECCLLEDPNTAPPEDAYQITVSPEKAPDKPVLVEIEFKNGKPVALNGKKLSGRELIARLNTLGAAAGVGRIDMVEDQTVGLKSREIYEAPAATILITAHRELEKMVISRGLWELKESLSPRYAWLVYQGAWFSEEKEALDAFFNATQRYASGKIKVKLYKGAAVVVERSSPHSLYSEALATYGNKDIFARPAAAGFIDLLGLPLLLEGRRRNKNKM